jgi:hypothetical protein
MEALRSATSTSSVLLSIEGRVEQWHDTRSLLALEKNTSIYSVCDLLPTASDAISCRCLDFVLERVCAFERGVKEFERHIILLDNLSELIAMGIDSKNPEPLVVWKQLAEMMDLSEALNISILLIADGILQVPASIRRRIPLVITLATYIPFVLPGLSHRPFGREEQPEQYRSHYVDVFGLLEKLKYDLCLDHPDWRFTMWEEYQMKAPATVCVVGPSGSGKSHFLRELQALTSRGNTSTSTSTSSSNPIKWTHFTLTLPLLLSSLRGGSEKELMAVMHAASLAVPSIICIDDASFLWNVASVDSMDADSDQEVMRRLHSLWVQSMAELPCGVLVVATASSPPKNQRTRSVFHYFYELPTHLSLDQREQICSAHGSMLLPERQAMLKKASHQWSTMRDCIEGIGQLKKEMLRADIAAIMDKRDCVPGGRGRGRGKEED